ncbi:peptide-methionine (S)-S-oxide reductase MsrA [Novosphingobium acidiphilum]|uniref:peptide-methionine (S)-S-oxide reductase MsrA n=1 Tax=Novosphingobium acidiphilum TaxID=505248 RepID=UPI00040D0EC0|nr:peptide-methionine (S)-S-oxide reductase MsrA [Novosphingobium acidiphilum]
MAAGAAAIAAMAFTLGGPGTAATGAPFPDPPAQAPTAANSEIAVLAGGCFWGMEGVFEHVKGVKAVTAGYTGGTQAQADYQTVSTETTNHAESVRIQYDPRVISYGRLLEIYFAVAHDPTQVNGQYPDEGRSYRSAIFPLNPAQRTIAQQYIATLDHAHVFKAPIATRIETGRFYPAEEYHQHFMQRHPDHPYIRRWDVERVAHLRAKFPQYYQ